MRLLRTTSLSALLALCTCALPEGGESPPCSTRPDHVPQQGDLESTTPSIAPAGSTGSGNAAPLDVADSASHPAADTEPLRVRGRLVVTDDTGRTLPPSNGTLVWASATGGLTNDLWEREVPVAQGAFEFETEFATEAVFLRGRILGTEVIPDEPRRIHRLDAGPLVVDAHTPRTTKLHVLDARTGTPLDDVVVSSAERRIEAALLREEDVVAVGDSPLELAEGRDPELSPWREERFWIHAPGRAWVHVRIDRDRERERVVRLERGGALEVVVDGRVDVPGRVLCVRSVEDAYTPFVRATPNEVADLQPLPVIELPLSAPGTHRFADLVPGAYRVTVESGEFGAIAAELRCSVVAERTTTQSLVVPPPASERTGRLTGAIHIGAGWDLEDVGVSAERSDPSPITGESTFELDRERIEATEDGYRFTFDALPLGEYEITWEAESCSENGGARLLHSRTIALTDGGSQDVRFDLAPAALVRVELTDATSGRPVVPYTLEVTAVGTDEGESLWFLACGASPASPFILPVPVGRACISALTFEHVVPTTEVAIRPGSNEFRFAVERACRVVFEFRSDDAAVEFRPWAWAASAEVEGPGEIWMTGGTRLAFDRPGRYVVAMPAIDGFEPIPDQIIEVERGVETRHVVPLTRSR